MSIKDLEIGDWVVVMDGDLISTEKDCSTYIGLPCEILEFMEDGRAKLLSPCKLHWGKPPVDVAPLEQLLKIDKAAGEKFVKGGT